MKKYGYGLLCSVFLFAILLLCFFKTEMYAVSEYPLEFSVEQDTGNMEISIHESEDGTCYVFLPSYAQLDALKIVMPKDMNVSLGGIPITDGMRCEAFELETAYSLIVDNQYIAELLFYQSANVATLYVDTLSGSMDRVHKEKTQSEQASAVFYTAEGNPDVSDPNAYIKGRGNVTWYYGKRPYVLTLSSAANVLGMGEGTKWILLANAADPTNLKNKLVLDLARQTGQSWSPESRFVDVYLNGEYAGLYLLTEKVEAGTSRVPLDTQAGDFLGKIDLERRWSSLKNPIKTGLGRTIEIGDPDSVDDRAETEIIAAINRMEQTILSDSDLSKAENFDLDSWVRRYLIDEISANIDGDMVSSYFYCLDGVFYAGPVWDYDMAFGNAPRNVNPAAFVAKNAHKIGDDISFYYDALYSNESFYQRMVECYQSEFLPLLDQWIRSGISDLASQIQTAARMNNLRCYGTAENQSEDAVCTAEDLISYLEERVAFLNSAWLENTEYCTLQFKDVGHEEYWIFSVPKGDLLTTDFPDLKNIVWVDKETGNTVDFSQPIMADRILAQSGDISTKSVLEENEFDKTCVMVLSVGVLAAFFFCMVFVDVSHSRKERRAANERKKSHVSP